MGLNLRSDADSITQVSKETRYCAWWALSMLDTMLSVITGRPLGTGEIFSTTPLPIPYREEDLRYDNIAQFRMDQRMRSSHLESLLCSQGPTASSSETSATERTNPIHPRSGNADQSKHLTQLPTKKLTPNTSLYFLYAVDLDILLRKAIETLYAPGAARWSWLEVEVSISNFDHGADNWLSRLPADFCFAKLDVAQPFARQCASLGFRFYSTKLLILQPCLRRAYHSPQMDSTGAICDSMAKECVLIAHQMLDLFPDEADTAWLFQIPPWWCVQHYMMQSTTVLLIELFTHAQEGTPEAEVLIGKVQKALRWLREISTKDPSSRRAWILCAGLPFRHCSRFAKDFKVIATL
ncbi:C6 transcription factor [Penicillium capsulatum]|uniref:C6 transcription factor n=1 Tax=Penicillium capsulatum TaxID=69766 RepID=A0A9W9I3R7_9EURO|nr:C6 transcription factor [Penicillium capsulatum]KAJ6109022.1 C6 transcription factor [Penicillium capsulatum]